MAVVRCRRCDAVIPDDDRSCPLCGEAAPGRYRRIVLRASGLVVLALAALGLFRWQEPVVAGGGCRILDITTRQQMFLAEGVMRNGYSVTVRVERTGLARYVTVTGALRSTRGVDTQSREVQFDIWPTEETELRFYLPDFIPTQQKVDVTCR
ncbi:hypothetical protein [Maritimibacter alkaliphilus]|uniref:hypothetical protein n=1 Tax=Maritimibacter alkaliphilus TaxID=404236 RepID=UPI001C961E68|nr:hypothetical protein [Maritimibacter alkaliphilus]MBY6090125.1 hypothetical protein [Maritimibacter alkaliphilus]